MASPEQPTYKVEVGHLTKLQEPKVTRVSVSKQMLDEMVEDLYRTACDSVAEPQYSKEEYLKRLDIVPVQWVTHETEFTVQIPPSTAPTPRKRLRAEPVELATEARE